MVRFRVIFLPCTLSSSLNTVHYTLSTTVCTCTPCQGASFTCKTDSFLWGHGPDTLACKARPSFDRCGTSLSVSLSLSLSCHVLDRQTVPARAEQHEQRENDSNRRSVALCSSWNRFASTTPFHSTVRSRLALIGKVQRLHKNLLHLGRRHRNRRETPYIKLPQALM